MKTSFLRFAVVVLTLPLMAQPFDLELNRSQVLTGLTPDSISSVQSNPVIRRMDSWYCGAWYDDRQGGMLMAARFDATGKSLDPLGIPLGTLPEYSRRPFTLEVISVGDRCTIFAEDPRIAAWTIPADADADPVKIVSVPNEAPWQISGTDGERVLISEHHPWGLVFHLIDANGSILWSHRVSARFYQLRGVVRGNSALVLVQPEARRGDLRLWRLTPDDVTFFTADVPSSPIYHWGVIDEGDSLLTVDLDASHDDSEIRFDRITDQGERIESWYAATPARLFHLLEFWQGTDGSPRLLASALGSTGRLYRLDGQDLVEVADDAAIMDASMSHDSSPLSLWRDPATSRVLLGFGPPGSFPAEPIAHSARSESVVDAVSTESGIAVLWRERSGSNATETLRFGVIDPEPLRLDENLPLVTGIYPGQTEFVPRNTAALAYSDGATLIAWTEGSSLKLRLRSRGEWNGPPLLVSNEAGSINPDGLIATPTGFLLAWTELQSIPGLRLTSIAHSGQTETIVPPGDLTPAPIHAPSILDIDGGYVVIGEGATPPCHFTCSPTSHVTAFRFDGHDRWTALNTDGLFVGPPASFAWLARDATIIALDNHGPQRLEMHGDALIRDVGPRDYTGPGRAFRIGNELLAATRSSRLPRIVHTLVSRVGGETGGRALISIPDASLARVDTFLPILVEHGGLVYLISSEVSLVEEEGSVRRLRIHELIPFIARNRAVSRR